jgi:hypothetical protein
MLFFKKSSDVEKTSWNSVQESSSNLHLSILKSESDLTEVQTPNSAAPKSAISCISHEEKDTETSAIETQISLPSSSLGMLLMMYFCCGLTYTLTFLYFSKRSQEIPDTH